MFQGGVLFQPASEFLPMIDEVCFLLPSVKKQARTNLIRERM
jgi:hypothetical protein